LDTNFRRLAFLLHLYKKPTATLAYVHAPGPFLRAKKKTKNAHGSENVIRTLHPHAAIPSAARQRAAAVPPLPLPLAQPHAPISAAAAILLLLQQRGPRI
jgi:hypothetical protein